MDIKEHLDKNLYGILGVSKDATLKEIKKAYYSLSKVYHPDANKESDPLIFNEITIAYDILSNEDREEWDRKSKWGKDYDESQELLDFEFDTLKKGWDPDIYENWKSENQLNILLYVDKDFKGKVEYERYVSCKTCSGSGKDLDSKITIRDDAGNVLKIFEGTDGCDFCEGTGKSWIGQDCSFCGGKGKVGNEDCKTCNGEKRILGKQKLKGIKIKKGEEAHQVKFMGNVSKEDKDIFGDLWVILR